MELVHCVYPSLALFISLIISCHSANTCIPLYFKYNTLPAFDGKAISDFHLQTHEKINKLWQCTWECVQDTRCRSYQFNTLTKTCSLFASGFSQPDKTFHPVGTKLGARLYLMDGRLKSFGEECQSTDNCSYENPSCNQGSCQCDVGYSYDPTSGNCVTGCSQYGDTFSTFKATAINENNRGSIRSASPSDCMQACLDVSSYTCVTFDFYISARLCYLADVSWFDSPVSDRIHNKPTHELYQRNCAA